MAEIKMSRAEDLFLRIESEGEDALKKLISDRASEELFLDFKRSADYGSGNKLHDHDRNNLKKSVCGFANSEGGVVIWGVDCSRSSENGDTASQLVLIENPQRFVSWLEGAVSGLTVPPVIGVRSIFIMLEENKGVVVTLIPKSTHAPHQLSGEGRYLIRAGSDFIPAPHGVVAGLFGRPPHPVVFSNFKINPASVLNNTSNGATELIVTSSLTVVLVNDGAVVAEDLFASFYFPRSSAGQLNFSYARSGWKQTIGFGIDTSYLTEREVRLAPRGITEVCDIWMNITSQTNDFEMRITTGCKGAIPDEKTYIVSREKLLDIRQKAIAKKDGKFVLKDNEWFDVTNQMFGFNT